MKIKGVTEFQRKTSDSFKHAFDGLLSSIKIERNMRIHIFIMFLVIIAGSILNISLWDWTVCIILFGAVISSELINTAIENLVDTVMPYKNEKAKLVKDIAASAVLIWAIMSAIIGLIIFIPKVIQYLSI